MSDRYDESVLLEREHDRHPIAFVALAVLIEALAVGILLGADALDTHGRVVGRSSSLGGERPIEELGSILHDPAITAHVGRQVALHEVPVESVVADAVFWVGKEGERVPVLLTGERAGRQPEERVEVADRDRVNVFGDLRRTEGSRRLLGSALLDEKEQSELLRSKVYVAADNVSVKEKAQVEPMARGQAR